MILKKFIFLILLLVSNFSFSQCFQIESILVDACDSGGTSADEGFNEMFRIKIGAPALNTSNLNVNWISNTWQGLIQNTTTATKVAQLNADIIAAGGCGTVLEPIGGVLPANATVIIVSSQNFNITLNSFGPLTANTYILFQDNTTVTTGHFGNYNATPGLRTLTVNFGTTCSDTVTYQRANLVNIFGISGGSTADNNGATVNFSPSGTPTYVNNGCTAPIPPFTVEAGTTPLSACPGDTINLTGTAQGQTSILWTAPSGSFSNPNNLITSYIVPTTAVSGSSITLTLTATNICGASISDNIVINISGSTLSLTSGSNNQTICSGDAITPIQYTFGGGATNVNITGLPAGVTSSIAGNVVTISGTPAANFSYSINTIGGCGTVTLNGTVALSSNATLSLTSGSNNQTICSGDAITPIQYTFGGGATNVNIIGLPAGVTSSITGNVVTISGTPAANFSYSINTIGGCGTVTLNGTVALSSNATLSLTSGSNNQTICSGDAITPIQYTFGGGATNVNITGLPFGVTSSIAGNVVTISGTPAANFSYSINTIGGCGTVTLNGTVSSTSGISPLFTQIIPVCQGTNINLPTTSTNGFTGIWQLISSSTTNVIYEFTPNAGQCASTTTMTIQIYPQPNVIISGNATYCDGDTTALTLTSTVPGTTFTWNVISSNLDGTHIVSGTGNTINQLLDLDNALNIGTATYYITPYANGCAGPAQQIEITVNPIPDVVAVATSTEICSGDTAHVDMTSAISGVTYTWTVVSTGVNGASNGTGSSIDQVLTTSNPSVGGNVVYTITPSLNGCTGASVTVQIDVKPRPEFFGTISPITICSGETTNINLSASIPGTDFEWIVVATNVSGASDGTGSNIGQTLTSVLGGTVVYSVVPVLNGCYGSPIDITVNVNPLPQPVLEDGTLCIVQATGEVYQTYTLDTGLSATGYSFDWYLDGVLIPAANGPTHIADEVGVYSVIVTNTTTTCVSVEEFATVGFVYPANLFTTTVTNAFTDNATITVAVAGGTGTLLYQLDEGALQPSNVFTGVSAGTHTVTVVDTEGCTFITQTVLVIDYPKYFTPNGDGENDTWNIVGMDQADAKLYIFDRYGKLIKQISPSIGSEGWDGTFNNQQLPSTDYWFTIDYTENGAAKQFKAHFSLKR